MVICIHKIFPKTISYPLSMEEITANYVLYRKGKETKGICFAISQWIAPEWLKKMKIVVTVKTIIKIVLQLEQLLINTIEIPID